MKRNSLVYTFACLIAVVIVAAAVNAGTAVETDYGVALRQNALLFRWPGGFGKPLVTERSFGISETRIRLWTSAKCKDVTVNAALESRASFMSTILGGFGMFGGDGSLLGSSQPLRHWDLTKDHVDDKRTSVLSRIDRLDAVWRIGPVDIDLGRQPLSMGTSHFVGVLDVVAPFAPGDLDATYKPGVDALRIRKGIGMTGEVEIIAVGAREWEDGALLGRMRTSLPYVDLEIVGGRFRNRTFGGFGWEGGTNPFGLWGEVAVFERRKAHEEIRGGWSKAAFSSVVGLDYYIEADFVLGGGLMFQDFGARDTDELMSVYEDAPYREGWAFLGSASYGVVTLSKEFHPLVQGNAAGLVNMIDGSSLWQPRITINMGDNTDLCFYGWIGTGKKSEIDGATIKARSEFGMMPDGGGFYARWFF